MGRAGSAGGINKETRSLQQTHTDCSLAGEMEQFPPNKRITNLVQRCVGDVQLALKLEEDTLVIKDKHA